jgi:hypothetical protein
MTSSDLANGALWYAALGIGGAALTIIAAAGAVQLEVPAPQRGPLVVAGTLAVAHSVTTARAAPINFSQRSADDDAAGSDRPGRATKPAPSWPRAGPRLRRRLSSARRAACGRRSKLSSHARGLERSFQLWRYRLRLVEHSPVG